MNHSFLETIHNHCKAGYQNLVVDTTELARCESELATLLQKHPDEYEAVLSWDCLTGFDILDINPELDPVFSDKAKDPYVALSLLGSDTFPLSRCLVVFRNLHVFLKSSNDITVPQLWQNLCRRRSFNFVDKDGETIVRVPILLGTGIEFVPAIRPSITTVDFVLPDLEAQTDTYAQHLQGTLANNTQLENPTQEFQDAVCRSLLGLTSQEAEDVLSLCAVTHRTLQSDGVLETIEDQKAEILKRTSALTYIHRSKIASGEELGGWSEWKRWIRDRKKCYTQEARALGIDMPKGAIIYGPPGTGKSKAAKVAARELDMPLIVFDPGALFGSLIGQSEQNTRSVLQTFDAVGACVIMIDEVDKIWGGVNEAAGDSGVAKRVFGKFLSWMQEKTTAAFVVMTANRNEGLPPELTRKGRLDESWSVDLPTPEERREILEIHMRIRNVDPAQVCINDLAWTSVLKETDKFTGSELEAVVVSARLKAFSERDTGTPTVKELLHEISQTVLMATTDSENLKKIREFCASNTRSVNAVVAKSQDAARTRRVSTSNN